MSMKWALPPRSKYSLAMLRPPLIGEAAVGDQQLVVHAVVDARELVRREGDARGEAAAAHRQRVEQAHLEAGLAGEGGEEGVLADGVEVVDEQADPDAARRGSGPARRGTGGRCGRSRSGSTGRRPTSRRGGSGRCGPRARRRRRAAGESRRDRGRPLAATLRRCGPATWRRHRRSRAIHPARPAPAIRRSRPARPPSEATSTRAAAHGGRQRRSADGSSGTRCGRGVRRHGAGLVLATAACSGHVGEDDHEHRRCSDAQRGADEGGGEVFVDRFHDRLLERSA